MMRRFGFTVVELLIVIVVIGILATLTIIAYSGVQDNARRASLQSDLEQAQKKLETYKIKNAETYPANQAAAVSAGIAASGSNTLSYTAYTTSTGGANTGYCLQNTINSLQYYVTAGGSLKPGACQDITNLAYDPYGTSFASVSANHAGFNPRWYGSGGSGTTSVVTGATDGPVPGITSYVRKTWTVVGSNVLDTAYTHSSGGTSGIVVSPGDTITASVYLRLSKDNTPSSSYMRFSWYDSSGNSISWAGAANQSYVANQWLRLSNTQTAPAGAAYLELVSIAYLSSNIQVGDTFDGTGLMITRTSDVKDFAGGNSRNWRWLGTTNNSQSTGPAL